LVIKSNDMETTVTGCTNCPMFYQDEWGNFCNHPRTSKRGDNEVRYNEYGINKSPDWCPLKKESITIKYDNN